MSSVIGSGFNLRLANDHNLTFNVASGTAPAASICSSAEHHGFRRRAADPGGVVKWGRA